jgi:hypothetical protein
MVNISVTLPYETASVRLFCTMRDVMRHSYLWLLTLGILFSLVGCAGTGGKPGKPTPTPVQVPDRREQLLSQITGIWETAGKDGKTLQAVFARDGRLTFKNALESYNPATWAIDAPSEELKITFSSVSLEAMQIFQLYVGQGVKAFHPQGRSVTYAFTSDTWTLNIAGWEYRKQHFHAPEPLPPEPVFR